MTQWWKGRGSYPRKRLADETSIREWPKTRGCRPAVPGSSGRSRLPNRATHERPAGQRDCSLQTSDRHAVGYNLPTDRRTEQHPFPLRFVVGFPTRHRLRDHRTTRLTSSGASLPAISSVVFSWEYRDSYAQRGSKSSRSHSDFRRKVVKVITQCGHPWFRDLSNGCSVVSGDVSPRRNPAEI